MSSKKTGVADLLDLNLERDIPTTPEDVAALERARVLRQLPPEEYQRWVELIEKHHPQPRRINTDADEPFTL